MLDWPQYIDNEKIFQRLINHLFSIECNSPGFIPSSPYIGADGAWDGYYNGHYDVEKLDGLWSIQSKWTKKSFDDAQTALRSGCLQELNKGKNNKVSHLRIATNAELRVEHVKYLEALNEKHVKTFRIWYRESLTMRIEKQPFLRHFFFNQPQSPSLLPPNFYFDKVEEHLLQHINIESNTFRSAIEKFIQFIKSKNQNILIFHAYGGYGKSHLLRELSQKAFQIDDTRQNWVVFLGHRKIEEAIQEEIMHDMRYNIFIDDSERYLTDINPLLNYTKLKGQDLKLILFSRTSGIQSILSMLTNARIYNKYEVVKLNSWKKEELIELYRKIIGQSPAKDEKNIVRQFQFPYMVVWIAKFLRKENVTEFDVIKKKFVEDIDYETKQIFHTDTQSRIEDLITDLACIVPYNFRNDLIKNRLCKIHNLNIAELESSIEKLLSSGILRKIGRNIRFNPDIKGDLYLAYKLEAKDDRSFFDELINNWFKLLPETIFINLQAATRYAEIPHIKDFFVNQINIWIVEADRTSRSSRVEILNVLEVICHHLPDETINIIETYLNVSASEEKDRIFKTFASDSKKLTTDEIGPILRKLKRNSNLLNRIINIILKLMDENDEGYYSDNKFSYLVGNIFSPAENNKISINKALDILKNWITTNDISKTDFLLFALSELMAGTHEYSESDEQKIHIGEKSLFLTDTVRDLRERGLQLIEMLIQSEELKFNLAAVTISKNLGKTHFNQTAEKDLPINRLISSEREKLLELIGEKITHYTDIHLISNIENLFIKWWALEKLGTDKVDFYLSEFPNDLEYRTVRYFISPDYAGFNFSEVQSKILNKKNRWDWISENVLNKTYDSTVDDYNDFVKELDREFQNENQIIAFLEKIYFYYSQSKYPCNPPIIRCWVRFNPSIFHSLRTNAKLWRKIPDIFNVAIDVELSKNDEAHFHLIIKEMLNETPRISNVKLDIFIDVLRFSTPENFPTFSVLLKLFKAGDSNSVLNLLFLLWPTFDIISNINDKVKLIWIALDRISLEDSKTLHEVRSLFHNHEKNFKTAENKNLNKLKKQLEKKLYRLPALNDDADKILEFAISNIGDYLIFLEKRFKFINRRVKYKNIIRKFRLIRIFEKLYPKFFTYLEAIPYRGLKSIKKKIENIDDFENSLNKMFFLIKKYNGGSINQLIESVCNTEDKKMNHPFIISYIEKHLKQNNIEDVVKIIGYLEINAETMDYVITDSTLNELQRNNFPKELCEILVKIKNEKFGGIKVLTNALKELLGEMNYSEWENILMNSVNKRLTIFREVSEFGLNAGYNDEIEELFRSNIHPTVMSSILGEPPPALVERKELFMAVQNETKNPDLKIMLNKYIILIDEQIETHIQSGEEYLNPKV